MRHEPDLLHPLALSAEALGALDQCLRKQAMRKLSRAEDAEDLVQETWLGALRSARSYKAQAPLVHWLRGIMRRRFADRVRAAQRSELLDDAVVENAVSDPNQQRAELHDLLEKSAEAFAALTALERAAVVLCDLEELEREEAAAQLGVSRVHLRVLLHRARQKLVRSLSHEGLTLSEVA